MGSFILFIVATIIKAIIAVFAYIIGFIGSLINRNWAKYHLDLAISIDQYGNVLCSYLFNWLLITRYGYRFGNPDETISSVIGKNKKAGTLTGPGKFLDAVLNLFEKDHSIKSIDNSEN